MDVTLNNISSSKISSVVSRLWTRTEYINDTANDIQYGCLT